MTEPAYESNTPVALANMSGTSLQGSIFCTFERLVSAFGPPVLFDNHKSDAEWAVLFGDGTVATIYNYKDGVNYLGPDEGTPTEQITDWHIGGTSREAATRVMEVLRDVD